MKYFIKNWIYIMYFILILIGIIGFCIKLKDIVKEKKYFWFYLSIIVGIIITISLGIYYMYATDYQPQGRYVFPILLGLSIVVSNGIEKILDFIKLNENKKIVIEILMVILIVVAYISSLAVYINSI